MVRKSSLGVMGGRAASAGVAIACALTTAAPAQIPEGQTPLAICDGRYAEAAGMLDAAYRKYGTLYSGGLHFSRRDDVGATIDLYRLWRGLDDLELREFRGRPWREDPLGYSPLIHELVPQALAVVNGDRDEAFTEDQLYIAAAIMDLATTVGPQPGWWVTETPDPSLKLAEDQTRLLAAEEPFVDWLLTVLAASDTPWAYATQITG